VETLKKIGKFVILPLVFVVFIVKIFFKKDIQNAMESLSNANENDQNLANSQAANTQASVDAFNQANVVNKEKEEIKNGDISVDWHKGR
jgi:hypothetical protein